MKHFQEYQGQCRSYNCEIEYVPRVIEVQTFQGNKLDDCLSCENHNESYVRNFNDLFYYLGLIEPAKRHKKDVQQDAKHDKTLKVAT